MQKIKQGDVVVIITGKDKGKQGKVLKISARHGKKVVTVENVNMIKKHVRPDPYKNIEGGIVERPAAVDISNVALWNPQTKQADRVGIRVLEDGRKVRYFKSNDEIVDVL